MQLDKWVMLKIDLEPQHTEKDPEVWNIFVLGGKTP